ncbi:hypothetical protein GCM10022224_079070 [Nonomuraea antimicrobica]|uniref:Lipoprotein n=1 Tax=Nonomuraea antimicrobica TaxID=561173 RepID=A0ABP7D6M5_9ACTN
MTNPARRMLSALLITLFVLAGCGGTDHPAVPTAAEAGLTLKEHITRTLDGAQGKDIKVTDPGGKDVPCTEGKVKRTYAATARDAFYSGDSNLTLLAMIGSLDKVAEYDFTSSNSSDTYQEVANKDLHLRIVLSAPAKGSMVVRGETECLPSK